ncbi:TonB family protein [candidate division KSB1 bacterium]|nr:TonB family protein [candidate division KSB1 bacterium]
MKQKKAIYLCTKALQDALTFKEKQQLEIWLAESPENRRLYNDLQQTWRMSGQLEIPLYDDMEQQWNFFKGRTVHARNSVSRRSFFTRIAETSVWNGPVLRRTGFAVAAVILALVLIRPISHRQTENIQLITETSNNRHQSVEFSDGSTALMNSGSRIEYSKHFSDSSRIVFLKGEAFFNVRQDIRPFLVITENARIRVMGTQFNVWARDEETRIVVKSGRVKFGNRKNTVEPVTLTQNTKSRITGNTPESPSPADAEELTGWMNGRLVFRDTPFFEALAEIERFYDKKLYIADFSSGATITAAYDRLPFETVLEDFCRFYNLDFKTTDRIRIELYAKQADRPKQPAVENTRWSDSLGQAFMPPQLRSHPQSSYPQKAQQQGLEGTVRLALFIDKSGKVTNIKIVETSGSELLDHAAKEYCKQFLFVPAKNGGIPINIWMEYKIHFSIVDSLGTEKERINITSSKNTGR